MGLRDSSIVIFYFIHTLLKRQRIISQHIRHDSTTMQLHACNGIMVLLSVFIYIGLARYWGKQTLEVWTLGAWTLGASHTKATQLHHKW